MLETDLTHDLKETDLTHDFKQSLQGYQFNAECYTVFNAELQFHTKIPPGFQFTISHWESLQGYNLEFHSKSPFQHYNLTSWHIV